MTTKPFKQPSGEFCGDCQHQITEIGTNHAACWSFRKELALDSEGKALRLDECKAEDE